nr:MAG TPA: hypothetical protein [Crassvirales sp.]
MSIAIDLASLPEKEPNTIYSVYDLIIPKKFPNVLSNEEHLPEHYPQCR